MKQTITFRGKLTKLDGKDAVAFPRSVTRKHFSGKPHEHELYNADMFPSVLAATLTRVCKPYLAHDFSGKAASLLKLDALPAHIEFTTNGFMATVVVSFEI